MRERFYSDPQIGQRKNTALKIVTRNRTRFSRAEGLAFPIWSYLSCYPARFMASPPFLRHLCRAAHKRALVDYLNAMTTWRFAEQSRKLGNMDCERPAEYSSELRHDERL